MTVLVWQARAARFGSLPERRELRSHTTVPSFLAFRIERALLALAFSALLGCSGPAEPKPENHACFRALDCQAGLVCVEGRCTADLTPIVPEVTAAAPPDAPAGDAGAQ